MPPRKNKILIIDDEKDFCFFIKANLQLIGNFDVIIATGGKKGIRTAHRHEPDLILLDILMPGIDGFEVLKRLKEHKKTRRTPIIMLTAREEDESKIKASRSFCEDYIVKPVEIKVLISKIEKVLSLK